MRRLSWAAVVCDDLVMSGGAVTSPVVSFLTHLAHLHLLWPCPERHRPGGKRHLAPEGLILAGIVLEGRERCGARRGAGGKVTTGDGDGGEDCEGMFMC